MKKKAENKPATDQHGMQESDDAGHICGLSNPQRSNYNPHKCGDGFAAKLWELLRRSPGFRQTACDLLALHSQGKQGDSQLKGRFASIDKENPIAGLVLRWLFRPGSVKFTFPRMPENFFKPWTLRESFVAGFPDLSEDALFELESLLQEENDGDAYPGPLSTRPGPFTLDTAWPGTPELFQFLFRWLFSEYEIGKTKGPFRPGESIDMGNGPQN